MCDTAAAYIVSLCFRFVHDQCKVLKLFCSLALAVDPLSNLGSLKNDLMLPPEYKREPHNSGDEDDELNEMLLGTSADMATDKFFNHAGTGGGAGTGLFGLPDTMGGNRTDDEMLGMGMGMSPDIGMMTSPGVASSGGFGSYMRKFAANQAAAAAAKGGQVSAVTAHAGAGIAAGIARAKQ